MSSHKKVASVEVNWTTFNIFSQRFLNLLIMDKTTRKEPIKLSELNFTPILVAIFVVLFTLGGYLGCKFRIHFPTCKKYFLLVIVYLIKKRSPKRTDLLLAGLCDSGKTFLYSLLLNGTEVETFTSLKENCGLTTLESSKTLRLVDLPGHERLRLRLLDNYKNSTKGLVFVIDSSTVQKDIKDVAE